MYGISHMVDPSVEKNRTNIECCSPLSSISLVFMTIPGTGSPLEVGTQPAIYMDYPFPSDRINSPSGTVDVTGRERETGEWV